MACGKEGNSIDFTYLRCQVISIRIMSMHHIRKIILLLNKTDSLVNKFIQMFPQGFFWTILITSTNKSDDPRFTIYLFHFLFIAGRNPFINYSPGKKIHPSYLWM